MSWWGRREERAFAHPTDLAPAAPDQDQPDHSQRRAIIRPLDLADHEARLRPCHKPGALADPKQPDKEGENAANEKRCPHGINLTRPANPRAQIPPCPR